MNFKKLLKAVRECAVSVMPEGPGILKPGAIVLCHDDGSPILTLVPFTDPQVLSRGRKPTCLIKDVLNSSEDHRLKFYEIVEDTGQLASLLTTPAKMSELHNALVTGLANASERFTLLAASGKGISILEVPGTKQYLLNGCILKSKVSSSAVGPQYTLECYDKFTEREMLSLAKQLMTEAEYNHYVNAELA